ncbi:MAG TPA: ABC transporter substrate-binding protein [Trichocoleus sp.]|jgi:NitT/TauT family transport system substrate-binding protein/sulfonate transport system substrate-binding protein
MTSLKQSFTRKGLSSLTTGITLSLTLITAGCTNPNATGNTASQTETSPTATTTLRIGFTAADGGKLPIGPIGWAEKQGYLDDEFQKIGVADIEFYGFDSGPGVNEAVAAGELDVSMNGDTPAIVGKTNGLKTRLINLNTVGINVYLVAKKNGPTSVDQLNRKTIGVRIGAIPHRYVVGLLEQAGLKGKVKIVNLTNSEGEAALSRGDIDAYAATAALAYRLKSQNYTVIDEAANHPDLTGSNVTSVTEQFLAAHPDFVQTWYSVIDRATRELKAQPQAYYQFVSQVNDEPLELSEFTSPLNQYPSEPLPGDGVERLRKTQQFLLNQKIVKSEFKLDDWVYNK